MGPGARAARRWAARVLALYGLAVMVIMYTPAADWFVRPLVVWEEQADADVIVVLAAWATPEGILNESGVWRAIEAGRLYRAGRAPQILVSGFTTSPDSGDPTAAIVSMLLEMGVPAGAVNSERESTNTHESAVRVAEISRSRHWARVILVTDAKHMRRARGAFVREGVAVVPAPTMMWELEWGQPYDRYRKFSGALHEYAGLLYYWWRGWI